MILRELPLEAAPAPARRSRRALLALLLRTASRALETLAERLALAPVAPVADPVLEFHAEAGAPEGALYVDGQLVGHLAGVNRL
ncbi:conserved hypothetical protein [Rubrivivax sp. A210]|uniref:hypothetical protein n=1 Tax=Rubrivivax sp. A210 TaxID=2772301 RepID=UPI0019193821|nr:hypothetical protein [Rubrivivax sp. A210]CAD5374067.1 conserved hypothetical protein [Rubrivivax sp. A210]